MTEQELRPAAAGLLAAIVCLAGSARGETSPAGQTDALPPCVGSACEQTAEGSASRGQHHAIKWNPGHYMASDTVIYAGRTIAKVRSEMDDINHQDAILGYRVYITWGALEPTMGNYDFSVLDEILARLKTAYNRPKSMVIYLWLYSQGALHEDDGSVIPLYIQRDSAYGASPQAGSTGWWGKNSNGASTGMYAPALYYQPVMDRLIALVRALGQRYDGEPYVEALEFQEDATIAQAASAFGANALYSDAAWLEQIERLLTASTGAFPHTSVIMDNTWFDRPPFGVALEQWMAANRIAPGTADSWGQSAIASYGTSHLSDGIRTLLGVDPRYGATLDLRRKTRPMLAVEGMELTGSYFAKYGGPWTPLDLVNALNQTYWASHAFWTHFFGNEGFATPVPAAARWSNLAATVSAHPLVHTDYPQNYP